MSIKKVDRSKIHFAGVRSVTRKGAKDHTCEVEAKGRAWMLFACARWRDLEGEKGGLSLTGKNQGIHVCVCLINRLLAILLPDGCCHDVNACISLWYCYPFQLTKAVGIKYCCHQC